MKIHLLKKFGGNFRKKLTRYAWVLLAVIFLLWGVIAFLTPFTPGSWLFLVGLFIIFGRQKTQDRLLELIGEKWTRKLKIRELFAKIPTKLDNTP